MIKNCWRNKNVTLAAYFSWLYLHIRYYMNMLCNCIAFFKILTVTKSFNSPENASTYFDYSSLLATHWIYPRAYIVQQQVNELFFVKKNICLLLASVFLKYYGLKWKKIVQWILCIRVIAWFFSVVTSGSSWMAQLRKKRKLLLFCVWGKHIATFIDCTIFRFYPTVPYCLPALPAGTDQHHYTCKIIYSELNLPWHFWISS